MTLKTPDKVYEIWDRLTEYPANQPQQSLKFLLESISKMINADHGYWLSAIRLNDIDEQKDIMRGWRPGPIFYYKQLPLDKAIYEHGKKHMHAGKIDGIGETTLNHLKHTGKYRSVLLRDLVSPQYFESPHFEVFYKSRNITDTLFVVAPVNANTEVYFGFNRVGQMAPFSEEERDFAAMALRGLRWFHKRVLLSHGLMVADKPLTATEKKVMHLLLTDAAEKEIADQLGQKPATTHKHICNIYRKFNVKSRAALMTIWLSH